MIGIRIRERRKLLRMTQDMLSNDLCDRSYLSKVEANKISPTLEFLEKVAARLQLSLQDLIGESSASLHVLNTIEIRRMIRDERYDELWQGLEMLWWQSSDRHSTVLQQSVFTIATCVRHHVKSPDDVYSVVMSLMFHGIQQGINEKTVAMVSFLCQLLYEAQEYVLSISIARAFLSLNLPKSGQIEMFLGLALNSIELHEWAKALDFYSVILERVDRTMPEIWSAKAFHGISTCEIQRENWHAAYRAAQRACQLYSQCGNESAAWLAQQNAAISLCAVKDLRHGIDLFHSCKEYWTEQQDMENIVSVTDDLVYIWDQTGCTSEIREVIPQIRKWQSVAQLPTRLKTLIDLYS